MADDPKNQDDLYTGIDTSGDITPNAHPTKFLGQLLNKVVGDKQQEEGVTPSMSPIDFIAPSVAGAMVEAAPRLLGNEIGAIGPGVAQLLAKQAAGQTLTMAEQIQLAAAKSAVQGPAGGLTNQAAMQQAGTPFQSAAAQNAALWQQAGKTAKPYAEGGEVTPTVAPPPVGASAEAPTPTYAPPPVASASGAQAGTVSVFNPQGELGEIPAHQLQAALGEGYREATPEDIQGHQDEEKYGGVGQQAIAALEGVAQGVAGPLATMVEKELHVDPDDILGRERTNPGLNMLGQGAGLLGGVFTGNAEAKLGASIPTLGRVADTIGAKVANKLLPEAGTVAQKIGSMAVKGAIENMVIQGSNEASKMILNDPAQSVETALVDVGLSGLIGGGVMGTIGSVNPLWKATLGKQTDGMLSAVAKKMGGIEGIENDAVTDALKSAGLEDKVAPEILASISGSPQIQVSAQRLMDSATDSGLKYQQALKDFNFQIGDSALEALGKTRADIANLENLNPNQTGENIKSMLKQELSPKIEAVSKRYDAIAERFKGVEFPVDVKSQLADDVANLLGAGVSAESAEAKLVQRVLKEIPGLQNLEQLRNYTSGLGKETSGIAKQELWEIGGKLRGALNGAEERALNKVVTENAPELLQEHMATNADYRALKTEIGALNDRLSVGAHAGPKTWLKALEDMDGETVLNRLNPSNKADIITELQGRYPGIAEQVRDFHLGKVLKSAAKNSVEDSVNPRALFKQLSSDKLSPQMRQFLAGPEALQKMEALEALLDRLPEKIGKSGTPQGLDGLMEHMPASATAVAALLSGHNPLGGALLGQAAKVLGRDAPDAIRLGMLKFLGSSKEIQPGAFKAMVDYYQAAMKGEKAIVNGAVNVFKAGREVLPSALHPTKKDRDRLDKHVEKLRTDPSSLFNVGGEATHYAQDHAESMGATAATATAYLNSIKPNNAPTTPLGKPLPVNPSKQAQYDRALNIAQQPLVVLDRLKKGTLVPTDVIALKSMYPTLYTKFLNQLTDNMTKSIQKGEEIPYNTRMGLSLFMGQPLDGTMTQPSILAAQTALQSPSNRPPDQDTLQPSQSGMKGLSKLPQSYQTPTQARAAARAKPSH